MFKKLSEAELDVMLVIWNAQESLDTGEIVRKLKQGKKLQAVQVLLGRLVNKGYVLSLIHILCRWSFFRYNRYLHLILAIRNNAFCRNGCSSFSNCGYNAAAVHLCYGTVAADPLYIPIGCVDVYKRQS